MWFDHESLSRAECYGNGTLRQRGQNCRIAATYVNRIELYSCNSHNISAHNSYE